MSQATLKPLTLDDVTVTLECLPEDVPVRGNAMASGDPDVNRETEEWIFSELSAGNDWAWACAKVTVRWGEFTGDDYLGACSYRNEADFVADGYYSDMVASALDDLNQTMARTFASLSARVIVDGAK